MQRSFSFRFSLHATSVLPHFLNFTISTASLFHPRLTTTTCFTHSFHYKLLVPTELSFLRFLVLIVFFSVLIRSFWPRDAYMHIADYAVARCASVRLSHAGILSKRWYMSYPQFFFTTILVFQYQMGWQYSGADPLPNAGVECKGVWKNHDFGPISRFISELMQDRATVTMEGEKETAPSFRMVPVWMILSDL